MMGQLYKRFQHPLVAPLLVLLLSLPAIRPLASPGYLEGHDSLVHLFRLVEFHRLFSAGYYYPRWFPDFALGYGYPLINFYSPLTYYVAEIYHLVGFGFIDSLKLTVALSVVLSGLGMYLYVNYICHSRSAAFLASIAYMYLPYRLVDIYVRGTFPEVVSLAFLPLLLLSFHALASKGSATHLITSGLLLAALLLTHAVVALFLPVLVGYALLVSLFSLSPWRRICLILVAILFGVAISSFNWLPAIVEQPYASLDNFALLGLLPQNQLIQFADLVQRHLLYDFQEYPFKTGLAEAVFALIGSAAAAIAILRGKRHLLPMLIFPVSVVLYLFMQSPFAGLLWEKLPVIGSVQYPWRLLTFSGLCTSLCISCLALPKRVGPFVAAAVGGFLIFATMASLPTMNMDLAEDDLSIGMIARHEFDSGIIGTTYAAEFLPAVAKSGFVSPAAGPQTTPSPDGLPILSSATIQSLGPLAYRIVASTPQPTRLRLHAFAFPGWQARVDGQPAPVYPSSPLGLVTLDVPSGDHTIDVSFEDTPVRTAGRLVSSLAFLLLACVGAFRLRKSVSTLRLHPGLLLAAVPLVLVALDFIPKAPSVVGDELRPISQRPLQADFGSRIRLLGFEQRIVDPHNAEITLYWQPLGTTGGNILTSLEWVDPDGVVMPAGTGWPLFATATAETWSSNEIVRDLRPLLLPDHPLKEAKLQLTVSEDGKKLGTTDLGRLKNPPWRARPTDTSADKAPTARFAGKIALVDHEVKLNGKPASTHQKARREPLVAEPGDKINVTVSWKALSEMPNDYTAFVHLYDRKGDLIAQHDSQPRGGFSPTSLWQRGDVIQDHHRLSLPSNVQPGIYQLESGLYSLNSMERLSIVGSTGSTQVLEQVKIRPIPAKLEPPVKVDATFGGALTLRGYGISSEKPDNGQVKGKIAVDLYWQAREEVGKDYKVFLHMVDDAGNIVDQQDGEPVDGNYSTSFWEKGEELVDRHEIVFDRDRFARAKQILIGLYDPETAQRLPVSSGSDFIAIPLSK